MRNIKVILAMLVMAFAFHSMANAQGKTIPADRIPGKAKSYISASFPGKKVASAKQEGAKYAVTLTDKTIVEFNKAGDWSSMTAPEGKPLANKAVPEKMQAKVKSLYKDAAKINSIKKTATGFEAKLTNNSRLIFDKNSSLKEILF